MQFSCISRGMTNHTTKSLAILALSVCASGVLSAAPDFSVSIHGNATAGITDGKHKKTGVHAHDPNKDYNLQGIELGLTMRANDYIEGFINFNTFLTGEDELASEKEEGFLKFKNLPLPGAAGTFEVRAGYFLNRVGTENNVHLHAWDYVNANLSTGLFLGEEGLRTEGAELSWVKEFESGVFSITGSYGKAMEHDHDHGHGDEHGDDDGHDDDDDHGDDDDHDEHGHEGESQELAYFNHNLVTVRAQLQYNSTDFIHHRAGFSYAQGDNGFGRDTSLIGADYMVTWRENGLEAGGKEISAGVEVFQRDVEWVDEDDASVLGDTKQQSFAVKTSYAWNANWSVGARYEWVEGAADGEFNIDKYQRASLALTHSKQLNEDWASVTRIQYNHDRIGGDSSNNVYLQLGFSYGGPEVR